MKLFLFIFLFSFRIDYFCKETEILNILNNSVKTKYEDFLLHIKSIIAEELYEDAIEEIEEFILNNLSISDEEYFKLILLKIDLYFLSNCVKEGIEVCFLIISSNNASLFYKNKVIRRLILFKYYLSTIKLKVTEQEVDELLSLYIEQKNYDNCFFDDVLKEYYNDIQNISDQNLLNELNDFLINEDVDFIMFYMSEINKDANLLQNPVITYCFVSYLLKYKLYTTEELESVIDKLSDIYDCDNEYYVKILKLFDSN